MVAYMVAPAKGRLLGDVVGAIELTLGAVAM